MQAESTTIMILTWDSADHVVPAVESSLEQTLPSAEVVVLDNGSVDGTVELVERRFGRDVSVVGFDRNLGYTGAYNRGIAQAGTDFVLLLNPDARLAPTFLEHALPAFDEPRTGIVAGRLMRTGGKTVDTSGQFLARSRKTIDRGYGLPYDPARDRAGPVLSACGAAALYRRSMLDDVADPDGAVLDPDYFAFNEDLELGWRAWRAGWRAVHVPSAVAEHGRAGGATSGRLGLTFHRSAAVTAHVVKNRWLSMIRHDRLRAVLRDLPSIAGRDLALLSALTLARPRAYLHLWRWSGAARRALDKRRADAGRRGRWGAWRREVPPRGVW
ncbi:MAG: glycosyltransferase family 2 protein [Acidobacteriota bacterium]|nr:glycosyltransferase family 2 protein [Acidobacteriota bacterium]